MKKLSSICFLLLASAGPIAAAPAGPPKLDIEGTCKQAEALGRAGPQSSYTTCMKLEKDAFVQIEQGWSSFSAASRANCVQEGSAVLPSYVDILTCLQMNEKGSIPYKTYLPPALTVPPPRP